jgi:hypothetical protein
MIRPLEPTLDDALVSLRRKLDDLSIAFPRIGRLREFPEPQETLRLAEFIEMRAGIVLQAVSLLRHEAQR